VQIKNPGPKKKRKPSKTRKRGPELNGGAGATHLCMRDKKTVAREGRVVRQAPAPSEVAGERRNRERGASKEKPVLRSLGVRSRG